MTARFVWTADKDRVLCACWLTSAPETIAAALGCTVRAVYARARALDLGPRDPVRRALWRGEAPPTPGTITLPALRLPRFAAGAGRAR